MHAANIDSSESTAGPAALATVDILGCNVNRITIAEALRTIDQWICQPNGRCRFVVATGFHGLWEAQKVASFRKVLNSADLFCPDGIAPVWLSRLIGDPIEQRVSGPDLLSAFAKMADAKRYSSFFLGDTPETLKALAAKLQADYPRHQIAGSFSPPFRAPSAAEDIMVVDMINQAKPDVLWVALGLPKQELWIYDHLHQLRVPVAMAVGAALSFVSGQVKRAPQWIGDNGFEWLWRLAMEPAKLWRRDLIDGPRFLAHAIYQCTRSRVLRKAAPPPGIRCVRRESDLL
jgi:N-acetylglucosaminyldiphosphoundecaprenol N-acetyl-beta-D-mannosaminyltransferase